MKCLLCEGKAVGTMPVLLGATGFARVNICYTCAERMGNGEPITACQKCGGIAFCTEKHPKGTIVKVSDCEKCREV